MNLRLMLLDRFVPSFVMSTKIRELFDFTAAAFEVAVPDLSGLGYPMLLEKYARFTKAESDKVLKDTKKMALVRERLHKRAFDAGLRLKNELKINSCDDVLVASRIFYRILGIEFSGDAGGNITINKCFFSTYFSAEHCSLISALDEGVAAGLSGGVLKFTQRITEKKDCCRATMTFNH